MHGFGRREFAMVLLRRMADFRPDLAEDAARRLGADRTAVRDTNRRWQAMCRSRSFPGGERRLLITLGAAEESLPGSLGDVAIRRLRWSLPLWPELRFEAMVDDGGLVWQEWLVRAPGVRRPRIGAQADLAPWRVVLEDLLAEPNPARLGPYEFCRDDTPSRSTLRVAIPAPAGRSPATLRFVWGLLQRVDGPFDGEGIQP